MSRHWWHHSAWPVLAGVHQVTDLNPVDAMTNLSPAAQAVLDAAAEVYWDWSDLSPASSSTIAAAALRAAADQVVPPALEEEFYNRNSTISGRLLKAVEIREELLAIATELEAQ